MELVDIKGVGQKSEVLLNKLNIYNVEDLLEFYPYRNNIYKQVDLETSEENTSVTINALI